MSTTHINKAPSRKAASKKTTANNRIPQMSERFKALDNERSESMSRLQDSLDCLRTMDWQCSHEAALKHLKGVIALLRDQAALERKCATACMKRGKHYTTPGHRHAELADAWAELAGCHQQSADFLVRERESVIRLYNAILKEDRSLLDVLLRDTEATG